MAKVATKQDLNSKRPPPVIGKPTAEEPKAGETNDPKEGIGEGKP